METKRLKRMERRKGESDHDKKDDHDEEAEDDDEVDDPKMLFSIEHIRRWWNVARRLLSAMRPLLCLQHKH